MTTPCLVPPFHPSRKDSTEEDEARTLRAEAQMALLLRQGGGGEGKYLDQQERFRLPIQDERMGHLTERILCPTQLGVVRSRTNFEVATKPLRQVTKSP